MTTRNVKLDAAIAASPDWMRNTIASRFDQLRSWIKDPKVLEPEWLDNQIRMREYGLREAQACAVGIAHRLLDVSEFHSTRPTDRDQLDMLSTLANLAFTKRELHRMQFLRAALTAAKITNGHMVSPDSYHIYGSDPTSPTGVHLVISGPKDDDYRELLTLAGRRTSTSNCFA